MCLGIGLAEEALRRIGELYGIEADIRGSPPDRRRKICQQHATAKVEALRGWLERERARLPGKSATAQAIRYALSRWTALARYLDDGTLKPRLSMLPKKRITLRYLPPAPTGEIDEKRSTGRLPYNMRQMVNLTGATGSPAST